MLTDHINIEKLCQEPRRIIKNDELMARAVKSGTSLTRNSLNILLEEIEPSNTLSFNNLP